MPYYPSDELPIRIIYSAELREYHIQEARRYQRNGASYANDVNNISNLGGDTWTTVVRKTNLADAVYNALDLMDADNRQLRDVQLGPARPTDPEVAAIVSKLQQLKV